MAELTEEQKHTQSSVNFEERSTHSGEFCAKCKHYIAGNPPSCAGVKSTPAPIRPMSWCHRFRTKGLSTI